MPYTLTSVVRRRLKKVRDHILAHPKNFAMQAFIARNRRVAKDSFSVIDFDLVDLSASKAIACGTACCIAGWFHLFTPKTKRGDSPRTTFRGAVMPTEFYSIDPITVYTLWPEPYCSDFKRARGPKAEARVAAARIDHLLATGE